MTQPATDPNSLFNRIGGNAAVNATVMKMYDKILADPVLQPFFKNLDMARQRRSQVAFLTMAFGGPHTYTGKSLTAAHARLIKEQGMNDTHFDAIAGHLKATLVELKVKPEIIDEVMTLVGSTREDVMGRKKA